MRISDWSSDVCSSDLLRLLIIAGDEDVEFRLQGLAARFGLVDLRLLGGLDLLRRGREGVGAGSGKTHVGDRDRLCLRGGGNGDDGRNRRAGDRQRRSNENFLHQNWVPTLNETRFLSSPSSLRRA